MQLIYSCPEFQTKLVKGSLTISVMNPNHQWRANTLSLRLVDVLRRFSGSRVVIDLQTVQTVNEAVLNVVQMIHQLAENDDCKVSCLVEAEKVPESLTKYSESHALLLREPTSSENTDSKVDLNAAVHFQLT